MSLNTWGGRLLQPLLDFIKSCDNVQIFCLQELCYEGQKLDADSFAEQSDLEEELNLVEKIQEVLPEYTCYFCPQIGQNWGTAIFIQEDIDVYVEEEGFAVVSEEQDRYVDYGDTFRRTVQWIDLNFNGDEYCLFNFHGLWIPNFGKGDNDERIAQSERVASLLRHKEGKKRILVGDFNLDLNTESLGILEKELPRNMIRLHRVNSTRTSYYKKNGTPYADYVLMDEGIQFPHFRVLKEVVSDHAPLYLEIRT
jgi:exonuclease III